MPHNTSPLPARPPTVFVIGGGFSGTALTAGILRVGRPVQVVVANRFGPIGRGIAYGARTEAHLLNVPARLMSAFPDEPEHFLRWAIARDPTVAPGDFVSRRFYGEYLEHVLDETASRAPAGASLDRIIGDVAALRSPKPPAEGIDVHFTDGRVVHADHVALALGNYSPANLQVEDPAFYSTDRYTRDPWVRGALDRIAPGDRVLLIGTGLTMMDIAIDLHGRGVEEFHAVSRHGLLPASHPATPVPPPSGDPTPAGLDERPVSIAALTRRIRARIDEWTERGGDWRDVIGSLRAATPSLWQALALAERERFLRHVRPFWEVHRHRAAPATAAAVRALVASGRMKIHAGRILSFEGDGDPIRVAVRPRGRGGIETIEVDRVVNCTGPDSDLRRLQDPFMRSLLDAGLVRPDPLGLGIETDQEGRVIGRDGVPSTRISLVGPLLKARDWEATAVPELRGLAAKLARRLLGQS